MTAPTTGWPPSVLMQDDDRRLSRALANTPHARRHAEQAAAAIVRNHATGETHLIPVVAVDLAPELRDVSVSAHPAETDPIRNTQGAPV